MKIRALAIALFAVVGASTAGAQKFVGSAGVISLPAPVKMDTAGMFQGAFVRVGDDVFIGGQPTERALHEMQAKGVTTVINLRTPEEMQKAVRFDEPALIKALGMSYVYIPMRGNAEFPYGPEAIAKFAAAVHDAKGKVLLHCTVAWRASHLWAAYLIKERGIATEAALDHARAINLMDEHHTGTGLQPIEEFLGHRVPELKGSK